MRPDTKSIDLMHLLSFLQTVASQSLITGPKHQSIASLRFELSSQPA